MGDLKSPTCRDCALNRGLVPVSGAFTVSKAECANCKQVKLVSAASDWKRRGQYVHPDAMD